MILEEPFPPACRDLLYLCERGYSVKQVVKLVGDHYRLTSEQRSILMRGVVPGRTAESRKRKLLLPGEVAGVELSLDSCNVLAAVGHYLSGRFVYIASDGILRDAAESGGIFRNDDRRRRAVGSMIRGLIALKPGYLRFYVDAPLTHSRDLGREIREAVSANGLDGTVELVNSADRVLKNAPGVLVTGDSEIIDAVDRVFDLARYVLEKEFDAAVPEIESIL